jgi:general stress protein 26
VEVVRDRGEFAKHWNPEIGKWFQDGVDTEGLVMLKIDATRAYYWDGKDEGEVEI